MINFTIHSKWSFFRDRIHFYLVRTLQSRYNPRGEFLIHYSGLDPSDCRNLLGWRDAVPLPCRSAPHETGLRPSYRSTRIYKPCSSIQNARMERPIHSGGNGVGPSWKCHQFRGSPFLLATCCLHETDTGVSVNGGFLQSRPDNGTKSTYPEEQDCFRIIGWRKAPAPIIPAAWPTDPVVRVGSAFVCRHHGEILKITI
jgi:hypothetical protein